LALNPKIISARTFAPVALKANANAIIELFDIADFLAVDNVSIDVNDFHVLISFSFLDYSITQFLHGVKGFIIKK
jgi:hypothetical protein